MNLTKERKKLSLVKSRQDHLQQAQKACQEAAECVQRQAHGHLAALVSRCLSSVFGEDAPRLEIQFDQKRGKTEARLVLEHNGVEIQEPTDEMGFGMLDVAAFALRLGAVLLGVPRKRKLLLLDEPFKHLASEYHNRIAELLRSLTEEVGVQIIFVTHAEGIICGEVVKL